ncbi:MAG: ribonuclease HII [Proteobacteria bacterium]|nr:ribonuclease HII [Pseudomonadota bacterium]
MPTGKKLNLFGSESFLLADWRERSLRFPAGLHGANPPSVATDSFVSLDEVGRGCVAGPVVVCATLWQAGTVEKEFSDWVSGLRDSKKMSAKLRERSFITAENMNFLSNRTEWKTPPEPRIKQKFSPQKLQLPRQIVKWTDAKLKAELERRPKIRAAADLPSYRLASCQIGFADAAEIDAFGIIPALGLAASRALHQIGTAEMPEVIFFDGHRPAALLPPWDALPQILVTKGDDLLKSISASSVIAKVVRDRWMNNYSNILPAYSFDTHCGYGTEKHRQAILKHGPSVLHRHSFLKNICPESVR